MIAETTVSDINGRRHEISRGKGVYGGRWDLAAKEDEVSRLTTQLAHSRAENTQLRQTIKHMAGGSTTPPGGGRGRGNIPLRGGGKKVGKQRDLVYEARRALMCLKYNQHTCSDGACTMEHACSRKVSKGTVCGQAHPAKDHQ